MKEVKVLNAMAGLLYLFFSLISGVFEIGVVVFGYINFDLLTALLFVLGYQIGCLFIQPFRIDLKYILINQIIALILYQSIPDNIYIIFYLIASLSAGLQNVRESLIAPQNKISESVKRCFRVLGFSSGIFIGFQNDFGNFLFIFLIIFFSTFLVTFIKGSKTKENKSIALFSGYKTGLIMMFHQIHYFAYAYNILLYFVIFDLNHQTLIHFPFYSITLFCLGWISYITGKKILKDILRLSSILAVLLGHFWLLLCLTGMIIFQQNIILFSFFWIFGGFGGGSVYAIKEYLHSTNSIKNVDSWENYGHVLGVSITGIIMIVVNDKISVSLFIAVIAIILTMFSLLKNLKRKNYA